MVRTLVWTLVLCGLVAGLGCKPDLDVGPGDRPAAEPSISQVSPGPVGIPTPPLERGRVETNLPEDWRMLPRRNDYVVAAYYQDPSGVPRLILTANDETSLPATTTREDLNKLRAAMAAELGAEKSRDLKLIQAGENYFVRHDRPMKFRGASAMSIGLETVQTGRRYRLELLTYGDHAERYLPALYRMAADLRFSPGEEAEPQAEESSEESPEEVPAEEDNAEEDDAE